MNSIEQFNPILFCDEILECIKKDMPQVLNDKIGYRYGRIVEQKDIRPTFEVMCMPLGEPKTHTFGSNYIEEHVPYMIIVEGKDTAADAYRSIQNSIEIAHFIRLMFIDDTSQIRLFLADMCGQISSVGGVGPLDGEGMKLFVNGIGFPFTLFQHIEWIGEYPPVTTIIKSLYRYGTEEYVEGETITNEEEPEEPEDEEPEEGA